MKNTMFLSLCFCLTLMAQAQVSKTISTTAGHLSTDLSVTDLNTVTNLAINGTIDARDFRIMRDSMPVLAVLDMSGVTISAYSGGEGTSYESIMINNNGSISYSTTTLKDYPANAIPDHAFYSYEHETGKTSLTSVTLPSSILSIGEYAFAFCSGINSISIPSSVNTIGKIAFTACSGSITVDVDNPAFSSREGVLFNKAQTTLIQCPISIKGDYTIPSSVTTINGWAFCDCYDITSALIPTSVTTIGDFAFGGCENMEDIVVPSSVTEMGDYVFSGCSGMVSVSIPSSLTSISEGTFEDCSNLTSISIPSSVTWIDYDAFMNCSGLTSIYVNWSNPIHPSSFSEIFMNVDSTKCTLFVPYKTKELYAASDLWGDFKNIVENAEGFRLGSCTEDLEPTEGSSISVEVEANVVWAASSDQSWLSVSPTSGTGDKTLTLTAKANTSDTIRTATVTVSASGKVSQSIIVSQGSRNFTITKKLTDNIQNDLICGGDSYLTSGTDDPADDGWLRLTKGMVYQSGYTVVDKPFPSSLGFQINFEYKTWKTVSNNPGADGFSVFLFDAATESFHIGGFGGSLGYAPRMTGAETFNGVSDGYIGIGFDEFGNFCNPTEGRAGGPGFKGNSISLRGSAPTYSWLTGNIDLPFDLQYEATNYRPLDSEYFRKIQIDIKPFTSISGTQYSISVKAQLSKEGDYVTVVEPYTLPTLPPDMLKLGFAASTGSSVNYHEIRNLSITNIFDIPQSLDGPCTNKVSFKVSPNPFTEEITLYLPAGEIMEQTEVYNLLGECIYRIYGSDTNLRINGTDNVYLLKVKTTSGKMYNARIIKKK